MDYTWAMIKRQYIECVPCTILISAFRHRLFILLLLHTRYIISS